MSSAVAILGAGTHGTAASRCVCQCGIPVTLIEPAKKQLKRAWA